MTEDVARALASYQRLDAWGVMPASGGWEAQTADFDWAVIELGRERALIEKERPKPPK